MGNYTTNLSLYNTDMNTDGNDYFDFQRDLNDNNDKIDSAIGKLANLTTTNKNNLVGAINEINNITPNSANKDLSNLSTTGETHFTNPSLSNLNVTGKSRLHALKGYSDEGELLTDSEGLNDVQYYAHSTYDNSKFTVSGTPIITTDGVYTGQPSSVVKFPISITNGQQTVYTLKYTHKTSANLQFILSTIYNNIVNDCLYIIVDTNNSFMVNIAGTAYTVSNFTLINGQTYNLEIKTDYKTYVKLNVDGTEKYSKTNLSLSYGANNYGFLGNNSAVANNRNIIGSIDLKQFSITVDGVPVFSGTKTGIDDVKPVNYTVSGTPTITTDGVASNFRATDNYVYSPVSISTPNSFEINFNIKTGSTVADNGILYISESGGLRLVCDCGGSGKMLIRYWNGASTAYVASDFIPATNTEYSISLKYSNNTLGLYVDNTLIASTSSYVATALSRINIGMASIGSGVVTYFGGSIDLNTFKMYVDGKLVYQPCLKIPYFWSKTGSKVVDSAYRNRVSDMYNQFGYAPYYTLSDSDFTLPQGELYGMIENKLDTLSPKQSEIDTIIGWSEPDYANGILAGTSLNTTVSYTAPSKGYIVANLIVFHGTTYVDVNSVRVATASSGVDQYLLTLPVFIQVNQGDEIEAFSPYSSTTYAPQTVYFYPCKGV